MNLLQKTKELCKAYNIKPTRSKGQNFLIREEVYDDIVKLADLNDDDIVLEVGPGLGFMTAKLAKKAKKVIAVELDDKLANALQIGLDTQGVDNVKVINENILEIFNLQSSIFNSTYKYKIVANLPYNITSVFLRKVFESKNKPESMVLMLQKEVAERIVAKPGKMSLLAVSVQFYSEPEIIQYVPKEDFYPQPEVDSAVIRLKVKSRKVKAETSPLFRYAGAGLPLEERSKHTPAPLERGFDDKEFFRLVKFGFSSKRKMLKNNLAGGYHISQSEAENKIKKAGFDSKIRAQELSVSDWIKLFGEF